MITSIGKTWAAAALCALLVAPAQAQTVVDRGRLLYETYCIACHTTEVHWRDRKLVKDWDSLVLQVRIWQRNGKVDWSEGDILEVAEHLNTLYYHLPPATRY